MDYSADSQRYDRMVYRRCGTSGLFLPRMSLGLWHNFGSEAPFENSRRMLLRAFDLGITHFDLANNYGPPPGSAEETLGRVLREDLRPYRDELIISTKAGYRMWPGPYGEWGSRKSLLASLDQSLQRMGLDYVDIFYHHRPDPGTPLEETMDALADAVRSGKALYVGLSNYSPAQTQHALQLLRQKGVPCLIHQMRYSMFQRENEAVLDVLAEHGVGSIAFSPLAQGLLTGRYLHGIPADSRAAGGSAFLTADSITPARLQAVRALNALAERRGQSLAQMALCWALQRTTSVILGASRPAQIEENVQALEHPDLTPEENAGIDRILAELKEREGSL